MEASGGGWKGGRDGGRGTREGGDLFASRRRWVYFDLEWVLAVCWRLGLEEEERQCEFSLSLLPPSLPLQVGQCKSVADGWRSAEIVCVCVCVCVCVRERERERERKREGEKERKRG